MVGESKKKNTHSPRATSERPRLLFQGDSITDAFRDPLELNPAFQLGNGYVFLIAAELALQHPGKFDCLNRGISGNGVQDLSRRWRTDTLALRPDILSILIGVNETIRFFHNEPTLPPDDFASCYLNLIDQTKNSYPEIDIVIIEPFMLKTGMVTADWVEHFSVRQKLVRSIALERNLVFVETQSAFDNYCRQAPPPYWAYDGIHPTQAGFAVLAKLWFDKSKQLIEKNL